MNVAATRAKSKVIVFCSFDPREIPQDEQAFSHNPDSTYFGRYLSYTKAVAEGNDQVVERILDSFATQQRRQGAEVTTLANAVKAKLEERGLAVTERIGSCGYFLDLAIRHPHKSSQFILGIECDGPSFYSPPYTRDRDKIRDTLLRTRGWHLTRVWPHDWAVDWEKEVIRIEQMIKILLSKEEAVSSLPVQ